jgi:hypothetical protein
MPDGRITNVTENLNVNFWNEDHDTPNTPSSYGTAGWTSDDRYVQQSD